MKHRAFFLDRDGTIIKDKGYICNFRDVEIYPFAAPAIALMNRSGFKVFVITNQSSIARGICTESQVNHLHNGMSEFLLKKGAHIDGFYFCPFHIDGIIEKYKKESICRKPEPGMLLQAAEDFNIDLMASYFIGDNECDIGVGKNCGCRTILVETGRGKTIRPILEKNNQEPDLYAKNLLTAVELILNPR